MFRKAKRLSQRFGINKEKCTEKTTLSSSNSNNSKKYLPAEESHGERTPQFLMTIDRVSTRGSSTGDLVPNDNDTLSTESSSNDDEELKVDFPKARPVLAKCQTAPVNDVIYDTPVNDLTHQLNMLDTGNLELLLSMETQARMDAQAQREKEQLEQSQQQETMLAPRPTKIKFELPVTPPRSRSPANPRLQYPRARPVRSLPEEGLTANALRHPSPANGKGKSRRVSWRHLFGDREDDDSKTLPLPITLDSRVRLKLRPLPTFGYVRFIGGTDFGAGEYIGVELDHGVGNCDGCVDGVRYFDADGNRGIFCKRRDLEAVPE